MNADLIFDLGCNNGDDTDFYVRKGFRVVAVDASEDLCRECEERFSAEIAAQRVHVIQGAITESDAATIDFYVNDLQPDWNTCDPVFAARNAKAGKPSRMVSVPTVRVADLLARFGVPYYMKVDIEGLDIVPLYALRGRADLPSYVSVELIHHTYSEGLKQIDEMHALGFKRFNFFNQGTRGSVRMPNPPLEGSYAEFDPGKVTSGPFGRELGGRWLDRDHAVQRLKKIVSLHRTFRDNPLYSKGGMFGGTILSKLHGRFRRTLLNDPVAWYDLHAAR